MLGSHDKGRIASRIGKEQARIAAMLLLTLPGTPILFAGDELAMIDVAVPEDQRRDPYGIRTPGYGLNRDPKRSPMRWDGSANAGFTSGEPWLPLGHFLSTTVEDQEREPGSHLSLVKSLIELRNNCPALREGSYRCLKEQGEVLLFERAFRDDRYVVAA
jgi:alpha-glucosidase